MTVSNIIRFGTQIISATAQLALAQSALLSPGYSLILSDMTDICGPKLKMGGRSFEVDGYVTRQSKLCLGVSGQSSRQNSPVGFIF